MNFQLPHPDDDSDYYGSSSQDESRGSQGALFIFELSYPISLNCNMWYIVYIYDLLFFVFGVKLSLLCYNSNHSFFCICVVFWEIYNTLVCFLGFRVLVQGEDCIFHRQCFGIKCL